MRRFRRAAAILRAVHCTALNAVRDIVRSGRLWSAGPLLETLEPRRLLSVGFTPKVNEFAELPVPLAVHTDVEAPSTAATFEISGDGDDSQELTRLLIQYNGLVTEADARQVESFIPPSEVAIAGVSPDPGTPYSYGAPPFGPMQIDEAFGIQDGADDERTIGGGEGETIAIVVAYNDPSILHDVNVFSAKFGLPWMNLASLQIENEWGAQDPLPAFTTSMFSDGGWGLETSMDVEWAHALAPYANIVLVEAQTQDLPDLMTAVNTARNAPNVSTVSMSWGVPENNSESPWFREWYDPILTTPPGHEGVTFFAATHDYGGWGISSSEADEPRYPSVSGNVVAVGGTSLTLDGDGIENQAGWAGGGGGYGYYEQTPSYQFTIQGDGFGPAGMGLIDTQRAAPDVAWLADPNTDVWIYDSHWSWAHPNTSDGGLGFVWTHWGNEGGTSLATPMWAGLVTDVNGELNEAGAGTLTGFAPGSNIPADQQTLPLLYMIADSDDSADDSDTNAFYDITSGNNGYPTNSATEFRDGFDLVTGLGTPNVPVLVDDMVSLALASNAANSFYVNSGATGGSNEGSNWSSAFTNLETALTAAAALDAPATVFVAAGTFITTTDAGDPTTTFNVPDGVNLIGGFDISSGDESATWDPEDPTVLSGDGISYHVVTADETDSIIKGFYIEDGNATGSAGIGNDVGGGIDIIGGSPTISYCTIKYDTASYFGGGIADINSSVILNNCAIDGDSAPFGGGIANSGGYVIMNNCDVRAGFKTSSS